MLENWRFDIFQSEHWMHAWNLWMSGWVIKDHKEWAFVLIIITFIPLWLSGWAALSMLKWEKVIVKILIYPWRALKQFFFKPVKIIAHTAVPGKSAQKKKSYKEIRPRNLRLPMTDRPEMDNQARLITSSHKAKPLTPAAQSANMPMIKRNEAPTSTPKEFDHSLFKFGENSDDDFDFNIDDFDLDKAAKPSNEKPKEANPPAIKENQQKNNNRDNNKDKNGKNNNSRNNLPAQANNKNNTPAAKNTGGGNSILDVIKQHGYQTINGATIKNNLIDFVGVARNQICLCIIDKEPGDWLADEERFNDEEPLWFSENSHRISPVRKVDVARKVLEDKLLALDIKFKVKPYVIIQIGNVINAEDMFDIWSDLGVEVTRIDRGTPKELKLFNKALDDAENSISNDDFEKIKKTIRNMA